MSDAIHVKETVLQVFTLRDLIWAVIGAIFGGVFGFMLDRIWSRIVSKPRFRIQVGGFESLDSGSGISLTITNVGFDPLPEYDVLLFHPKRGTLNVFHPRPRDPVVFPQHPEQWNRFECTTGTLRKPPPWWQEPPRLQDQAKFLKGWFLTVENEPIAAPSFADFRFQLVLRNSELVLFEDDDLGNSLAKQLFESVSGQPVEQEVKHVFYKSKAPWWVELIRRYKTRRMLRELGLK
jgi:hypothetical protein